MRSVYRTPRKFVNPEEEGRCAGDDGGDAYMTGQFQLWKQGALSPLILVAALLCGQPVKSVGQKSVGVYSHVLLRALSFRVRSDTSPRYITSVINSCLRRIVFVAVLSVEQRGQQRDDGNHDQQLDQRHAGSFHR